MKYETPKISLLASAIRAIQKTECPGKGIIHLDSTSGCQEFSTPPAYEADE